MRTLQYFACTFIAYFLFIPCALADDANFYNCQNGFYGCNAAQLTSDQQQVVTNSKTAPTQPSVGAACAENGSCYGDISNITGQPKTTAVQGYYRKDGTYVRGHYRSHR